jgi:hypothetical protein
LSGRRRFRRHRCLVRQQVGEALHFGNHPEHVALGGTHDRQRHTRFDQREQFFGLIRQEYLEVRGREDRCDPVFTQRGSRRDCRCTHARSSCYM